MKFKAVTIIVFSALLLATVYCLVRLMKRSDMMALDAAATRSEVLRRIPIGTSITLTQSIMEDNDFTRRAMKNQRYADFALTGRQVDHGPADILWCDSGERMTKAIVISKRWQVAFEDKAGRVSDIGVGVGLTGF